MTLVRPADEHVTSGALSQDGSWVAVGFADGAVEAGLLDPTPTVQRLEGLARPVELLVFSPEGDVVLGAAGAEAVVWHLGSGEIAHRLAHPAPVVDAVALAPDRFVTLAGAGVVRVWEPPAAGEQVRPRELPVSPPFSRCASDGPDGLILTRGFEWLRVRLEDGSSQEVRPEGFDARDLVYYVGRVAPTEGGRQVFIYWDDGRVFDAESGRCLQRFVRTAAPGDVAVAGTGEIVAVGSAHGKLLVHDLSGGVHIDRQVTPDEIVQVRLSRDGRRALFVDLNGGFGLLDVSSGRVALSQTQLQEIREPVEDSSPEQ